MQFDTSDIYYFTSGPRERVLKALIDHGYNIKGVFTGREDKYPKIRPSLDLAAAHNIPVTTVNSKAELDVIAQDLKGAFCLSLGFHYLFPASFLSELGLCLNVHGTLLPFYPGARTLNWIIENGESKSGVTVHVVDEGMDTGDIVLQKSFDLTRFDTGESLMAKTLHFEPEVVLEALDLIKSGQAQPQKQPDLAGLSDADKARVDLENRTPAHSELDPSQPLAQLYDKIRAAHPEKYPAHFYVDGEKVCVKIWREDKDLDELHADLMI